MVSSKRFVRSGPLDPGECFACGDAVRAPAVHLEGATGNISLHPPCGERLGVAVIGDAREARRADPQPRAGLQVVNGGRR